MQSILSLGQIESDYGVSETSKSYRKINIFLFGDYCCEPYTFIPLFLAVVYSVHCSAEEYGINQTIVVIEYVYN